MASRPRVTLRLRHLIGVALIGAAWLAAHYLIIPNVGQHAETCTVTALHRFAYHWGAWELNHTWQVSTAQCGTFDASENAARGISLLGPGQYELTVTGVRSPATQNNPVVRQAAYLVGPQPSHATRAAEWPRR